MVPRWCVAIALVGIVGCPGGAPSWPDAGGGEDGVLTVTPLEAIVAVVVGGAPAKSPFAATLRHADGTEEDVTAAASWSIDDGRLGMLDGSVFTAGGALGGRTTLRAQAGGQSGTASITVRIEGKRIIDPAPALAPQLVAAAAETPARAPTIAYPADGTIVPPNLGELEVHFRDSSANDLFEVDVASAFVDLKIYVTSTSGATVVALTEEEWDFLGKSLDGGAFKVLVRGMAQATPGEAGTSSPITVGIAGAPIEGGLYYWTTGSVEGRPEGIYRHDFARPKDAAEAFYTTVEAGRCVGCHALSRDGSKMAVTFDGGNGPATVVDVATRSPIAATDGSLRWNFATFAPGGEWLLTVYRGTLTLRDGATGADLGTVVTSGYATHPDWSPRGDAICYVTPAAPGEDWLSTGGRIVVAGFDHASQTFGDERELVPPGSDNAYYPSWSPGGDWILFNRSSEDTYDDSSAQLWAVPSDGSLAPILVGAPNQMAGLTNSWPRWAPFEQTAVGQTDEPERLYWFTFSSRRAFGVRLEAGRPQLWMAPFFPGRAAVGQGPSAPAFRLPFQDLGSANHISQWAEQVVDVE